MCTGSGSYSHRGNLLPPLMLASVRFLDPDGYLRAPLVVTANVFGDLVQPDRSFAVACFAELSFIVLRLCLRSSWPRVTADLHEGEDSCAGRYVE